MHYILSALFYDTFVHTYLLNLTDFRKGMNYLVIFPKNQIKNWVLLLFKKATLQSNLRNSWVKSLIQRYLNATFRLVQFKGDTQYLFNKSVYSLTFSYDSFWKEIWKVVKHKFGECDWTRLWFNLVYWMTNPLYMYTILVL